MKLPAVPAREPALAKRPHAALGHVLLAEHDVGVVGEPGERLGARLLAGAITLIFFTYAFVNMGMVSGILPVVGVPLPLVSYGGTALVTLFLGLGILMSIHKHRKLVQT